MGEVNARSNVYAKATQRITHKPKLNHASPLIDSSTIKATAARIYNRVPPICMSALKAMSS